MPFLLFSSSENVNYSAKADILKTIIIKIFKLILNCYSLCSLENTCQAYSAISWFLKLQKRTLDVVQSFEEIITLLSAYYMKLAILLGLIIKLCSRTPYFSFNM